METFNFKYNDKFIAKSLIDIKNKDNIKLLFKEY